MSIEMVLYSVNFRVSTVDLLYKLMERSNRSKCSLTLYLVSRGSKLDSRSIGLRLDSRPIPK